MNRRKFLSVLLVAILLSPLFSSFVVCIGSSEITKEKAFTVLPLSIPEEESKEDETSHEQEKKILNHSFPVLFFTSLFERNDYFFNHNKPINGCSDLPYNPPELA